MKAAFFCVFALFLCQVAIDYRCLIPQSESSDSSVQVPLKPRKWIIDPQIHNAPLYRTGQGIGFMFPVSPFPDPNAISPWYGYCVRPWHQSIIRGELVLTFRLNSTQSPVFNFKSEVGNTCSAPGSVRLYFQSGDLYNPIDGMRWWSNPVHSVLADALNAGEVTLRVPLQPDQWSSTFGHSGSDLVSAFYSAAASPSYIGFTMGGGCFFGHGLNVSGGTVELEFLHFGYAE